jgi:predicted CopG family antitoxin
MTTIRIKNDTLQSLRLEKAVRQKKSYDELIAALLEK